MTRACIHSWIVKGDTVYFALSAETTGWVAIGIDPVTIMENADMIFGWVDDTGNTYTVDAYATGPYGPHPPDEELGGTNDILESTGTEQNGITTIEFSRRIDTGDAYDKLTISFIMMIWAMLIARYLKKRRWWLKAHRTLEIWGVSLGIIAAEYMLFSTSVNHFRIIHSYFGVAAVIALICTPVISQLIFKGKKEHKPFFRKFHRWLGRSALLLTFISIVLGLFQINIL